MACRSTVAASAPYDWAMTSRNIVLALLLALAAALLAGCSEDDNAASAPPVAVHTRTATATPAAKGSVTLVAVGDVMLDRSIGQRVLASGPGVLFDDGLLHTLKDADLTVGNLECSVSERGSPQFKGYTFRAPPSALASLELAGFDVMSLANNHALDYGEAALLDTIRLLSTRGIAAVGAGENIEGAQAAKIVERGGLRIAFVGLVDVEAEGAFNRRNWEATKDGAGVAWADRITVDASVRAAARSADLVVAMLHFGVEFNPLPVPAQRELARTAIDAGADLVIGSHSHVLQEVEEYGHGLIVYSLGNFIFDGFEGPSNASAVLRVTLTKYGVTAWKLLPVDIINNGIPRLRPS